MAERSSVININPTRRITLLRDEPPSCYRLGLPPMSGQPLSQHELGLIQAGQVVNVKYVNLSVVVFLAYHSLINLDDEIKYIWGMKWGIFKCFYIATKYLAFCDGIIFFVYLLSTNLQPSTCDNLYTVTLCFIIFGVIVAEIIVLIRTWIAWGLSRCILWYLTFVVVTAISTALFILLQPSFETRGLSHSQTPDSPPPISTSINCFLSLVTVYKEDQYLNNQCLVFVCIIVLELSMISLVFVRISC